LNEVKKMMNNMLSSSSEVKKSCKVTVLLPMPMTCKELMIKSMV